MWATWRWIPTWRVFLETWWENFMVSLDKKHLDPIIYFIFSPHNQTNSKKVSLPIFSSKFSIHPIPPPNKHTLSSFFIYFLFFIFLSSIEYLVCNVYGNRNLGKSKLQLYLLRYKILNRRNSHWGISKPSSISKRYKILTLFVHFLLLFGNGFLLIEVVCLCCFDIFIGFWSTPFL